MTPELKKALAAIYSLVNLRHKELLDMLNERCDSLEVAIEKLDGEAMVERKNIEQRQQKMLENEVDAIRKNITEEVAKLDTRFNMTETAIEAVIGTKEFQDVIGSRLEAARKEVKTEEPETEEG